MDFSKKFNYVLIGPGSSGKSFFHNKLPNKIRAAKLDKIGKTFFTTPTGLVSYCSINYLPWPTMDRFVSNCSGRPIKAIVCECPIKILRRRLTDRFFNRLPGYKKNDDYFRRAMSIFSENYNFDYSHLFEVLKSSNISYHILDTNG